MIHRHFPTLTFAGILVFSSGAGNAQSKYLPVLHDPVDDVEAYLSSSTWDVDLSAHFSMEEIDDHVVRLTSNQPIASGGFYTMDIALFSNAAPASRTNFLAYVNDDDYPGTFIDLHSLTGNVLRSGFYEIQTTPSGLDITAIISDPFVPADGNISHTFGTVGMQKAAGTDNIGNPFFFNLDANSDNLDGTGNQTGVIGRVTLSTIPTLGLFGDTFEYPVWNFGASFPLIPVRGDYDGAGPVVETDLIVMDDVSLEPVSVGDYNTTTTLTYAVVSTGSGADDNTNLLTSASMAGSDLSLVFANGELGSSTVVVKVTDSIGTVIEDTFIITRSVENYETWRANQWAGADFADDAISGPLADPNGDGVTNLHLYAQGFTANDTSVFPNKILMGNGTNGELSFRLSKTANVTVLLEQSDDLDQGDAWSPAAFTELSRVDMGGYYQINIEPTDALQDRDFYRIGYQLNP